MKLSVTPGDPGYRHDARLCAVTLDGKRIAAHHLISADDESGIVCTLKRDGKGEPVIVNGDTVTVIRRGKVTIGLPAPEEVPFE